jgi:hypothetical protein
MVQNKRAMTEREEEHNPRVREGENELPQPHASPLDPYTPEPGPGRGEGRAFKVLRLSWIAVAVLVAIVVYAAVR